MVVLKLLVFCASVRGNLTDIRVFVPSVKTKKKLQMWRRQNGEKNFKPD